MMPPGTPLDVLGTLERVRAERAVERARWTDRPVPGASSTPVAVPLAPSLDHPGGRLIGVVEHLVGDFAQRGHVHEVRVPGVEKTVFVVPTITEAERLVSREGISRGRVWTGRELADAIETCLSPQRLRGRRPGQACARR